MRQREQKPFSFKLSLYLSLSLPSFLAKFQWSSGSFTVFETEKLKASMLTIVTLQLQHQDCLRFLNLC